MKKGFLTKAFVAVGVMASALALSSVCAFAAVTVNTVNNASTSIVDNASNYSDYWLINKKAATINSEVTGSAAIVTTSSYANTSEVTISNHSYTAVKLNDSDGTVTFNANSGDTFVFDWATGKKIENGLVIKNSESEIVAEALVSINTKSTNGSKTTITFDADGTYTLVAKDTSNDIYLGAIGKLATIAEKSKNISNGDKFYTNGTYSYIVHSLSATELSNDKITLTDKNGDEFDFSKVYSKVTFEDGSYVEAADGGALLAIKVANDVDATQTPQYTWTLS